MISRFGLLLVTAAALFGQTPEQRAISYLETEVNSWRQANGCYSCHNNGDGARALYEAVAAGRAVRQSSVSGTSGWLSRPAAWDGNKGDPAASDKRLARIQWAYALSRAVAVNAAEPASLEAAAELLVRDQNGDGSWPSDAAGSVGSPVTWGVPLSTAHAIITLRSAGPDRYAGAISAGEQWLRRLQPENTPAAAALVFAFKDAAPEVGRRFLKAAQASDGGWGPYRNTPSEVFDTALAVLALDDPDFVRQGREYLLRTQLSNGGWLETTRPSGSQSYAQHISTSAWALMALIASDGKRD